MKNLFLLLLLVISLCKVQSKDIITLSPENLTTTMNSYDMGFIMFYEPESPRYQSYGPVLYKAVPEVKAKQYNSTVLIAEINVDKYPQLKEKYGISQIPTILWFNNKRNYSIEYSGETEMTKSFIEFIELQLHFTENCVKEIAYFDLKRLLLTDSSEHKSAHSNPNDKVNNNMIVICAKNKEKHAKDFQIIVNSAWNSGIKYIFFTKDKAFDAQCTNDAYLDVIVYKLNERNAVKGLYEVMHLTPSDLSQEENYPNMIHFEHFASFSSQKMERLFIMYSKDTINLFNHHNEDLITQGITTLTIAHKFELNREEYSTLLNGLIPIAKANRKNLIVMIGGPRTRFSQQFAETFRLSEINLPVLCVTANGNPKIEKYRLALPSKTAEMLSAVNSFLEKVNKKEVKQYVSSEDLPEPVVNANGLHRLVGINYSETVNQKKDVLVVFCSDKISVCREFAPRLEKMALRLKESKDLIVASVNHYTNEVDYGGFNYLPGIVLFSDVGEHKGDQGVEFKGKALTRDIIKFIKENAKHPIEVSDADEKDVKEEYAKEIKRMDLNDKGIGRKLFMQLKDPELSQMYLMPNKDVVLTEYEYIQHIIYSQSSTEELKREDL